MQDEQVRDMFAAMALQGLAQHVGGIDPAAVAVRAFDLADAMMAERERRKISGVVHRAG